MITLAVEMKGASVAQICKDFDVAFAVIRIIYDKLIIVR